MNFFIIINNYGTLYGFEDREKWIAFLEECATAEDMRIDKIVKKYATKIGGINLTTTDLTQSQIKEIYQSENN